MTKITFTGDLMSLIPENQAANSGDRFDYSPIFKDISPILKESDYVIGNLETPVANEELGWTKDPTVFNTPKEFAKAAYEAGFSFFSLANNHCLDRGVTGAEQTIENLDCMGVDHTGMYKDEQASLKPFVKNFCNSRIALLSYTYGTNSAWQNNKLDEGNRYRVDLLREQDEFRNIHPNPLTSRIKKVIKEILPQSIKKKVTNLVISDCVRNDAGLIEGSYYYNRIKEKIAKAKAESDLVVMLLHSGGQYNDEVGAYTKNVVRQLVDMGCDMVVVNHPHCILPFEYVDGKLVVYALGNFCFTPNYGYFYKGVYADYSLLLHIYMEKNTIGRKSVEICKVVEDKSGHSIVVPLEKMIEEASPKKKRILKNDREKVLKRFFREGVTSYNKVGNEYYF